VGTGIDKEEIMKLDYAINLVDKVNSDSTSFVGSFGVYPRRENSFVAVMPENINFQDLANTSAPKEYLLRVHILTRFKDWTDTAPRFQEVLDYYNGTLFKHFEGHNIVSGKFITTAVPDGRAVGLEVMLEIASGNM